MLPDHVGVLDERADVISKTSATGGTGMARQFVT